MGTQEIWLSDNEQRLVELSLALALGIYISSFTTPAWYPPSSSFNTIYDRIKPSPTAIQTTTYTTEQCATKITLTRVVTAAVAKSPLPRPGFATTLSSTLAVSFNTAMIQRAEALA